MESIARLETLEERLGQSLVSRPVAQEGIAATLYGWACGCAALTADNDRCAVNWCPKHRYLEGHGATAF